MGVNEPVAGNYYPVNTIIALEDKAKDAQLAIVTDVTQGGASLAPGEIELMVHRRIQADDSRGVQEPLNETMCGCNDINAAPGNMGAHGQEGDGGCECAGLTVRGKHWLVFDTIQNVNEERRLLQEQISFPATTAFTEGSAKITTSTWSALQSALPKNVRLMKIKSATAMSVTGNQPIEEMDAKKFAWKTHDLTDGKVTAEIEENGKPFNKRIPFNPKDPKLTVTLRPMEVRTFLVRFQSEETEFVM